MSHKSPVPLTCRQNDPFSTNNNIIPITESDGKKGKRVIPANPLRVVVYVHECYGFAFRIYKATPSYMYLCRYLKNITAELCQNADKLFDTFRPLDLRTHICIYTLYFVSNLRMGSLGGFLMAVSWRASDRKDPLTKIVVTSIFEPLLIRINGQNLLATKPSFQQPARLSLYIIPYTRIDAIPVVRGYEKSTFAWCIYIPVSPLSRNTHDISRCTNITITIIFRPFFSK